jgi:hypothetical protein
MTDKAFVATDAEPVSPAKWSRATARDRADIRCATAALFLWAVYGPSGRVAQT